MTQNSWNSDIPIKTPKGGTGNVSFTDSNILVGRNANPIGSSSLIAGAGILIANDPGSITITNSDPGNVLQTIFRKDNTKKTITNPFPLTTSPQPPPQITDGATLLPNEIITPILVGSTIKVTISLIGASNVGDIPGVGIFKTGNTNALITGRIDSDPAVGAADDFIVIHQEITVNLNPIEFVFRGGPQLLGRTFFVNHLNGGFDDGGAFFTVLSIIEYR